MIFALLSSFSTTTETSPWLEVFGRAHPVLLHSPLGLLPALAVLEFGALLLRKTPPRGAVIAIAWLCALTGAAAAASGLVLAGAGDYSGDTIEQHKLLGIALGVLCLLTAILACLRGRRAFRVVLLLTIAVMFPAGHLGGSLTHGHDFLFAPLAAKAERPTKPDKGPVAGATNGTVDAPQPAQVEPSEGSEPTQSEFVRVIQPLLERTCTKCHNEDKQKAELLLTTIEGIRKGSENGEVIVPGKPDESPLLTRCELPLDDDDHMPPEGKPQPTAEELAALRAWIAAGAKFD